MQQGDTEVAVRHHALRRGETVVGGPLAVVHGGVEVVTVPGPGRPVQRVQGGLHQLLPPLLRGVGRRQFAEHPGRPLAPAPLKEQPAVLVGVRGGVVGVGPRLLLP
ncbi:hypothetical protein [Streptomyces sp. HUAS ZL42]|uniref:hypothetical protein n=1 Tax=Streptomyces sp. HUAS ZL42 TaxID=3231715 RepID=UPI00345EE680